MHPIYASYICIPYASYICLLYASYICLLYMHPVLHAHSPRCIWDVCIVCVLQVKRSVPISSSRVHMYAYACACAYI